jgi:hypothetical protein
VVAHPLASALLANRNVEPVPRHRTLRGIADDLLVYEIP